MRGSNVKDETGNRYGKLTVIERSSKNDFWLAYWKCRCDCGEIRIIPGMHLRAGHVQSCGCAKRKHGEHVTTKFCNKCGQTKSISGFFKRADKRGGIFAVRSHCKQCWTIKTIDERIALRLRNQLNKMMRGKCKCHRALELLGCSIEDFKIYLESRFDPGMNWDNYGTIWHIDHIVPCAIFDLIKPEHQKRCFHFSNMQPLLARENLSKGKKVLNNQYPLI